MSNPSPVLFGDPPPTPPVETERTMLDRLNARYAKTYRNGTHESARYFRAEHVPTTAGFNYGGERIADYIAIDVFMPKTNVRTAQERALGWSATNGSIHGHEVKVSRSDYLTELADPTKAEAWARHCHHWWMVAPKDIVRDDLPDGWGLLIPWRDSLKVAVQARRRDPEPMLPTMLASLVRKVAQTEVREAGR